METIDLLLMVVLSAVVVFVVIGLLTGRFDMINQGIEVAMAELLSHLPEVN